jgi:hypothetical protein
MPPRGDLFLARVKLDEVSGNEDALTPFENAAARYEGALPGLDPESIRGFSQHLNGDLLPPAPASYHKIVAHDPIPNAPSKAS